MGRLVTIAALVVTTTIAGVGTGVVPASAATTGGSNRLAPIVMRSLADAVTTPVVATDNALHALYELSIVDTQKVPVHIDQVDVRTLDTRVTVASFEGPALVSRLRQIDGSPLDDATIAPGEQVIMFVDVGLFNGVALPLLVDHRVTVGDRQFNLATVSVDAAQAVTLHTPVNGRNWVVREGCCGPTSTARTTVYPTEAGFSTPGRFAVDLEQMDVANRLVTGDPSLPSSYPSYGQYANAVAAGRVVAVVDGLPDQVPGAAPPIGAFDDEDTEGNSVVVALDAGHYAFYGGLRAGSIIVKQGSFVRKGQPLAQIGNSADGTEPHLHFELLSGPDRIGADGVPFVLDSFAYAGHLDPVALLVRGLGGPFTDSRLTVTQSRTMQLPLDGSIVDFQSSSGSSGNPLL